MCLFPLFNNYESFVLHTKRPPNVFELFFCFSISFFTVNNLSRRDIHVLRWKKRQNKQNCVSAITITNILISFEIPATAVTKNTHEERRKKTRLLRTDSQIELISAAFAKSVK